MANQPKSKHIPRATIQRLATYVQVLENFSRDNVEVISSNPLAEACGVNGSQVRKDLAYFGEFGIRGVGYHVKSLIAAITSSLGVDREWRMALIGVGNLGKAILNHSEFRARGFNIVGIFDCDPFKIGERNIQALETWFRNNGLRPSIHDVGGTHNRTISIEVKTGGVSMKMPSGTQQFSLA